MKKLLKKMDKPLLFFTVLYSALGLILVLSASSVISVLNLGKSPYYFFFRQLLFITAGYFVAFFYIIRKPIKQYSKFMLFLLVLLMVALIGLILRGQFTNNARSWFNIAGFGIQPSEFGKLILILFMALFYGNFNSRRKGKYDVFIPIGYSVITVFLILLQPDLGTAIIVTGIVGLTFLSIPLSGNHMAKILKIGGGAVAIVAIVLIATGSNFMTEEQLSRLQYKEPCRRYTEKTGYQVCNGFIAINNGGIMGKGLGNSTQKYLYLPEAYTDFIFPIAVEELGVVVCSLIILGYLFIFFRILLISKRATNLRNSILCYGIAMYLLLHLLVNFMGILALIPLTGVPVPFLSYGGSFTLCMIFAMFLVQRVAIETKQEEVRKEIDKI